MFAGEGEMLTKKSGFPNRGDDHAMVRKVTAASRAARKLRAKESENSASENGGRERERVCGEMECSYAII